MVPSRDDIANMVSLSVRTAIEGYPLTVADTVLHRFVDKYKGSHASISINGTLADGLDMKVEFRPDINPVVMFAYAFSLTVEEMAARKSLSGKPTAKTMLEAANALNETVKADRFIKWEAEERGGKLIFNTLPLEGQTE